MKSRTEQAIDWMRDNPGSTQQDAADRFGISQPAIAARLARDKPVCPCCGKRDILRHVIDTYAWHTGSCAAYDDDGAVCNCGFSEYLG